MPIASLHYSKLREERSVFRKHVWCTIPSDKSEDQDIYPSSLVESAGPSEVGKYSINAFHLWR